MRKFAASLLSLALLLSLTACGSAETKQQENMQWKDETMMGEETGEHNIWKERRSI